MAKAYKSYSQGGFVTIVKAHDKKILSAACGKYQITFGLGP